MVLKVMNVAEKPSVADAISKILGNKEKKKKRSASCYNPIFYFDYYINNEMWKMTVTSVTGHLTDNKFHQKYSNWNTVDPYELFDAEIVTYIDSSKKKIEKNLLNISTKNDLLILWLDCDREGENIAYEVINICKEANRKLKIKRAIFSAVTNEDIINAIHNLTEPNINLSNSVEARKEIDLRMGAAFTRFLTKRYMHLVHSNIPYISYGMCQFPTLGFIVNRYLDIKNFQQEYYWTIKMEYLCDTNDTKMEIENKDNTYNFDTSSSEDEDEDEDDINNSNKYYYIKNRRIKKKRKYKKDKKISKVKKKNKKIKIDSINISNEQNNSDRNEKYTIEFKWSKNKLFDHLYVTLIYENLLKNPICTITNVIKTEIKKYKPLPLNTLQLTKCISRYFKISSKECMNIAESLYNKGYISYPRTETNFYNDNINLKNIIQKLKNNTIFGYYAKLLIDENKFKNPRKGKKDDKSHPPIHPVKNMYKEEYKNKTKNITKLEYKIYEFICRHFLATCSEDAIGMKSKVIGKIGNEYFNCSGLTIIEKNYLDIYIYENWNQKYIPDFNINDIFIPYSLLMNEYITEPPSLLTEHELLSLMDKYNIGTDATMHEHIENVQIRKYACKENSFFVPTNLGIALILSYKEFSDIGLDLTNPSLRSRLEKDLSLIAIGQKIKMK